MKRRRLTFLITELDQGGAERALVQLVTGLSAEKWDRRVISLGPRGPLAAPLEAAGVPVDCLNIVSRRSPRSIWGATVGLSRILKQQQPDLLQTFLFHANLTGRFAARIAGVPRVVSGIRVAERRGRLRLNLDRWTDRLVDRHVCVSRSVAEFSIQESKLDPAKVVVIPNGVDVERFRNAIPADLARFGIPAEAEVLIAVGRLDAQKDPHLLLDGFEMARRSRPALHLLLVGHGRLESELKARVAAASLEDVIHFAGWQPDIAELMKASDVFALTSRWEGMPNVVLEAGAAGLPVVATRVEGVEEILDHGKTGTLIEPGDAFALADAIVSALADASDESGCLASTASRVVKEPHNVAREMADTLQLLIAERFTWGSVVAEYDRLYADLLAAPR
jgi:glycosyltransferase involved in cell wall biosynthesis